MSSISTITSLAPTSIESPDSVAVSSESEKTTFIVARHDEASWVKYQEQYSADIAIFESGVTAGVFKMPAVEAFDRLLLDWDFRDSRLTYYDQMVEPRMTRDERRALATWETKYTDITQKLHYVLNPFDIQEVAGLPAPDTEAVSETNLVLGLLHYPSFQHKGILTHYLARQIEEPYLASQYSNFGQEAERQDMDWKYTRNEQKYVTLKEIYAPLVSAGLVETARQGDFESITKVMNTLETVKGKEIADMAIAAETLPFEAQLNLAVHYINTFGFMAYVEVLSPLAKHSEVHKAVYERLHGREVEEVMGRLSEVYTKSIDAFSTHYADEVTLREVSLAEKLLLKRSKKPLAQSTVLDLAAGMGRVSRQLAEAGCGKVISVEPQDEFVQILQGISSTSNGHMEVHQAKWDDLSDFQSAEVDLGVCVGRSLPHANTVPKLIGALLQMRTVAKTWLIDYPDPSKGEYLEKVSTLRDNLVALGVEPSKVDLIHDSPDGKHFFGRMVLNEDQLKQIGMLTGMKVSVVGDNAVGDIRNVYYSLSRVENFDVKNILGDKMIAALRDLGLLTKGTDFDMYIPEWGMTLAQAIIYSHTRDKILRDIKVEEVLQENKNYGVPKATVQHTEDGEVLLSVGRSIRR